MNLVEKIDTKSAKIGIVGLGYVGLPLAVEFAKANFKVVGIDKSEKKVASLEKSINYIDDVDDNDLKTVLENENLKATTSYAGVKDLDILYICVPTPFTPNKEPDITYIVDSAQEISKELRKDQAVILKSTTFPETTEKVLQPILEQGSGLKAGKDFHLAFSPERIDPGNKIYNTSNTPTVVGGITPLCTEIACKITNQVVSEVVPVSSPRVAEMEKLLENIFRSVNIALVNELARLCDRMGGIDLWEVIDAASTKPFGFMPFYPGPGIGGHCILVDPYYLSWKAREYDFHTNFIELAAETNEDMPFYVLGLVRRVLNDRGVAFSAAKILILGVAFKKDIDDTRNSPALKVMKLMIQRGAKNVSYNDPFVPKVKVEGQEYSSIELTDSVIANADLVLITAAHSKYDYENIVAHAKAIVDTRNATKNVKNPEGKVLRLGGGQRPWIISSR